MAKFNPDTDIKMGQNLHLKIGAKPLAASTACKVNIQRDMKEIACKEMGEFKSFIPGKVSSTISSDQIVTNDYETMKEAILNKTLLTFAYEEGSFDEEGVFTAKAGGEKMEGKCYLNQLDVNAPDGDVATYTASFQVTERFS